VCLHIRTCQSIRASEILKATQVENHVIVRLALVAPLHVTSSTHCQKMHFKPNEQPHSQSKFYIATQSSIGIIGLTRLPSPQDRLLQRIKQPTPKREQCMLPSVIRCTRFAFTFALAITIIISFTVTFTGDAVLDAHWLSLAANRVSALRCWSWRDPLVNFPLPRRINPPVTRSCS